MSKTMKTIYRGLAKVSPEMRQVIIGAGLAIDPLPECRYPTFERSDEYAMKNDWAAVAGDLWGAIGRAERERRRRTER